MRTFNIGETVTVPRFVRGEIVGHVTGTVTVHHTSADPASAFYLIRVGDREVGHYPHEMRPAPRHLSDAPADGGASATARGRKYPKHATPDPTRPQRYRDPWAGNPDTDKHWSKER